VEGRENSVVDPRKNLPVREAARRGTNDRGTKKEKSLPRGEKKRVVKNEPVAREVGVQVLASGKGKKKKLLSKPPDRFCGKKKRKSYD